MLVQYAKDPRFSATISHQTPDSTDSKEVLERVANLTYLVKQSYHLKSLPVVEVVKFGGHKFARTSITREKWMLLTGYVPIKHKVYFAEFHYPKKGEENGQDIGQWLESIVKKTYFDLAKRSKIQSSQSFK